MRFLILAILFAACSPRSSAQSATTSGQESIVITAKKGAVSGIVLNSADGKPLSMVFVQAEVDGKVVADDMSDYRGHYRLGPLSPGHYKVTARFANARIEYKGVSVRKQEHTNVGIHIDLRDHRDQSETTKNEKNSGTIEGVIIDRADGTVFPGTVVALQAPHLRDVPMAISDNEGRFSFGNLRPGTYSLSCFYNLVKQGNVEIRRNNIKVLRGETTAVELKLDLRIRYDL